jgi:hypothetical protein
MDAAETLKAAGLLHFGNESPEEQFFVIKYKDKFAVPALWAYATAIRDEVRELRHHADNYWDNPDCQEAVAERKLADELEEFALDIEGEAEAASRLNHQIPS